MGKWRLLLDKGTLFLKFIFNWKIIAPQRSVGYVRVCVSCSVLSNILWPLDCSPPGSSVHRNFQTRILEWIAIPFSTGSSLPRDQNQVSHTAGRFFALWATRKAHSVGWESLKKRFPFLCTYRKDLVEFWEDICTHICTHWVSQKFLQ